MKSKYKKRGEGGVVTVTIAGTDNIDTLNELIDLESKSYKKMNYTDAIHFLIEKYRDDKVMS